jgi:hypothetical protein
MKVVIFTTIDICMTNCPYRENALVCKGVKYSPSEIEIPNPRNASIDDPNKKIEIRPNPCYFVISGSFDT